MPVPLLIPIVAAGATAAASFIGGSAVTSFFNARGEEDVVKTVVSDPDTTAEEQANILLANQGVNPNSPFQPVGDGILSDYTQSIVYDNTSETVYHIYEVKDSPNTSIDTTTTQKTDTTRTTDTTTDQNIIEKIVSSLGGAVPTVIAFVCLLFVLKTVKDGGKKE